MLVVQFRATTTSETSNMKHSNSNSSNSSNQEVLKLGSSMLSICFDSEPVVMYKYYECHGSYRNRIDGEVSTSRLFGSYDREECQYELDSERDNWIDEGLYKLRITVRLTPNAPMSGIYDDSQMAHINSNTKVQV